MKKNERKPTVPEQPRPRQEVPRVTPDPTQGLTMEQVQLRHRAGWANTAVESPTKSVGQIVRENVCTFFNFIFIVLAALLIAVGSFDDMLFLLIAAANTGIGIIQQLRSKQTIDKLNLLSAPRAKVVREGNLLSIPAAQLVRDDVAEFSAGDQIPADATVLAGQVQVNEALITGEADAITKKPGEGLLSGSFIVSGKCRARLDQVGADSYAARLTLEAKKNVTAGKSEMMASLDKLIRFIGIVLVPLGVALFIKEYYFLELGAKQAVVSTVAALIGMIPEGLYLLTSVALAVSVVRLARGKVLAQDMSCIETLARVDVLCVDKTGTITEPHMEVGETVLLNEERWSGEAVTEVLNAFYRAVDADNDTAKAMRNKFHGVSVWHASHTIPFTSATKWSGAVFPGHGAYLVGAPEFVLGARYAEVKEQVEPWSAKGYRVLLVAEYDGVPEQRGLSPQRVSPMALVLLSNRVRAAAPKTFQYFAEQGVHVKVISGDNPITVSEVARQAGIPGAEHYVDAAALKSDGDLERAAVKYTVFGRVTPGQKRKLVRALQKAGHTVAMTGDGVNDLLALREADCSIAVAAGSDAARQVSQIVLLDSDFSALPNVLAQGRRVVNNITRVAGVFFVKTIYSVLLSVVCLLMNIPFPLIPIQVTLTDLVIEGYPAFFMSFGPDGRKITGRFLPTVLRRAAPNAAAILVCFLILSLLPLSAGQSSVLFYFLVGAAGIQAVFKAGWPLNRLRAFLCVTMTLGFYAAAILFRSLLQLELPDMSNLPLLASLVLVSFLVERAAAALIQARSAPAGSRRGRAHPPAL